MKITLELPDTTSVLKVSGVYDIKSGEKAYTTMFKKTVEHPEDKMILHCITTGIGKGKLEISEGEDDT